MSVDQKKDFCVEGGWFGGATGAMVEQKKAASRVVAICY